MKSYMLIRALVISVMVALQKKWHLSPVEGMMSDICNARTIVFQTQGALKTGVIKYLAFYKQSIKFNRWLIEFERAFSTEAI